MKARLLQFSAYNRIQKSSFNLLQENLQLNAINTFVKLRNYVQLTF